MHRMRRAIDSRLTVFEALGHGTRAATQAEGSKAPLQNSTRLQVAGEEPRAWRRESLTTCPSRLLWPKMKKAQHPPPRALRLVENSRLQLRFTLSFSLG